ncbi:13032_t:CDS:2 [Gigaspora margarita]|uniref:13032_t:CDS:1 n=1 Tax=Gigaspora margarita TaxID=4874 RepID=A0ABN7V6R9_GIGMA|nr:13032_t:CDS:2 [Gigaspora margarita]
MADTLNELISNNLNNEENKVIKQYEYNLFGDFTEISRSPFGIVRTATWENSTIVLKSITIDTSQIDSGIIGEITNAINTNNMSILDETTMQRIIAKNMQKFPYENWIEGKIIEGKIIKYMNDEFEDRERINKGASSKVYKARFKSTKDLCALKLIEKNEYTNKEIENELKHMISIESHENIIKFYGIAYETDKWDPNVVEYILIFEYADNGTLREYLNQNSNKIEWALKVQFAIQLVTAKPIDDTNHGYVAVYQRCWQDQPENRPSIEEVAMKLEDIIDIDDSFNVYDISEFEIYIDTAFESIAKDYNLDATTGNQDDMNFFVNNLYSAFRILFNEGRSAYDILINFISESGKTKEEVFQWLSENDNLPKYICLLGLFYHWKIGTDENNTNVIELFINAANQGDIMAQYFTGKCYAEGWNTSKNKKKALDWYSKAADNECAAAECLLGEHLYRLRKYTKAFDFLNRAVEHGNLKALNTLGLCYQKGQGTVSNAAKGFELFKKVAEMGLLASQYELGNCYEYGIGVGIDLNQAKYWFEKATDINNIYRIHLNRVEKKINNN